MCLFFYSFLLGVDSWFCFVFLGAGMDLLVVHGLSLVVVSGSYSLVVVHELLIVATSLVAKHGL